MELLLLRLGAYLEMRNCVVLCLTETRWSNNMTDSAFQIAGLQIGPKPSVGEKLAVVDFVYT